jgi:hypothetical protein
MRPADREIARFREIVAENNNSLLLADGGPHSPDAALLDLCAEALHLLTHAERARAAMLAMPAREERERRERARHFEDYRDGIRRAKPLLSRIRKLRATTGPGIYAKALVVRASITGAPHLAKSLAEDLVACDALRATLWAAEPADHDGEARP